MEAQKINVHDSVPKVVRTIAQITVINGDTLPLITLKEFRVYGVREFKNPKEAERYDRLKWDVKKVYPYAKLASKKLKEYNAVLAKLENEKQKKAFFKIAEKEIKAEFEDDLKNLTMRQGRILIKLIDRETGNTSYELVKDLRGSFSAFVWQSLARMFGSDLKAQYDAEGEDKMIEDIIILIENGDL